MPHRSRKATPRAFSDPRRAARIQDFRLLDKMQWWLKRQTSSPMISDEQLAEFSVSRSSPFDIDQDDPIDVEPRYFLPGPLDATEQALEECPLDWSGFMRDFHPVQNHMGRGTNSWHARLHAIGAECDARHMGYTFNLTAGSTTAWHHDRDFPSEYLPSGDSGWELPDGRAFFHLFDSGCVNKRMVLDEHGDPHPHPNLPHSMGVVRDGARPRGDSLLRSELLMAVALIKTQVRKLDEYLDHNVLPALVLSFHGRFSARVLQAHLYNGRLIIRSSRLIKLHMPTMTPDMKLLLRWHNSLPVGETRRLPPETGGTRDEGAETILHFERPQVVSRPTGHIAA